MYPFKGLARMFTLLAKILRLKLFCQQIENFQTSLECNDMICFLKDPLSEKAFSQKLHGKFR